MLRLLLIFLFLQQAQGNGVRLKADVEIGDETAFGVVVKDIMHKYLKNGKAEIDIVDLLQVFQKLIDNPRPVKNNIDDAKKHKNVKSKQTIKENNRKIKHKSEKKHVKHPSDNFSDDSEEKAGKKRHKSRKTKHAKREHSKAKHSKHNKKVDKGKRKAYNNTPSKKSNADYTSKQNERVGGENKANYKRNQGSNDENSSEIIHIYGNHEGVKKIIPYKNPVNSIEV